MFRRPVCEIMIVPRGGMVPPRVYTYFYPRSEYQVPGMYCRDKWQWWNAAAESTRMLPIMVLCAVGVMRPLLVSLAHLVQA